ncbi:uncharacterized protein [Haliotis asinina]|uniref:uncharacterized protein n=1 Tax=Haliotis asinina TaxID=109174 RepID=UPI003531F60E
MRLYPRDGRATTPAPAVLMFLLFCHMEIPEATGTSEQNQTNISTDHQQVNSTHSDDASRSTSSEDKMSPFCPDGKFSRDGITCSPCAMGCPESMYISTPCSPEMDTQCVFCPSSNVTEWNLYPGCIELYSEGDNASTGLLNNENEMLTSCETDYYIFAYFTVPVAVLNVLLFGCLMLGWCCTCTDLCQSCKTNETIPAVSRIITEYINPAYDSFITLLFNRARERNVTYPAQHRIPSVTEVISGVCEESDELGDNPTVIPTVSDRQVSCTCDRYVQTVCESNVSSYSGSSRQRTWNIPQPSSRSHVILNDISLSSSNNEDRTKPKSTTSECTRNERVIRNEFHVKLSRHCEEAEDLTRQQRILPMLHKFDTCDICCYYLSDSSGASSTRSSIIGDPRLNNKKDGDQNFIRCIDDFTETTVIRY